MNETAIEAVDGVIQARRTTKMLAAAPLPAESDRAELDAILAAAGNAPFHKPSAREHRKQMTSLQPWRCYSLDATNCRRLREKLIAGGDQTKIPQMLAAATALIQFTWLPNPSKAPAEQLFEPTIENMEHIAAASSAVQSMLLAATVRGYETYWSSGGALREATAFHLLGIPDREILLGAIFLFPASADGVETAPGKLHDKRGDRSAWARWVELD